jgi:hypothetical protein
MNKAPEGFCILCGCTVDTFDGLTECPNCHTKALPCHFAHQVNVTINLQELRVLCMLADAFAKHSGTHDPNIVPAIAARIKGQLPQFVDEPLTMLEMFGMRTGEKKLPKPQTSGIEG